MNDIDSLEAEVKHLTRRLREQAELLTVQELDLRTLVTELRQARSPEVISFIDGTTLWLSVVKQQEKVATTHGVLKVVQENLDRMTKRLDDAILAAETQTDELRTFGKIIEWKT